MNPHRFSHRAFISLVHWRCATSTRSFSIMMVRRPVTTNITIALPSKACLAKTTPLCHLPSHLSHRCASTDERGSLVYTGPLSSAVRAIKIFSISTACCSVVFGPILVHLGNPATPVIGRLAIASLVTTVGLSTTFILHWFIKSYVTKLYFDRSRGNVTVETLSLFGKTKVTQFHVSEAKPPDAVSAFSTFQSNGKHFFLHTELFEDSSLLRQLLGSYAAFEDNLK